MLRESSAIRMSPTAAIARRRCRALTSGGLGGFGFFCSCGSGASASSVGLGPLSRAGAPPHGTLVAPAARLRDSAVRSSQVLHRTPRTDANAGVGAVACEIISRSCTGGSGVESRLQQLPEPADRFIGRRTAIDIDSSRRARLDLVQLGHRGRG